MFKEIFSSLDAYVNPNEYRALHGFLSVRKRDPYLADFSQDTCCSRNKDADRKDLKSRTPEHCYDLGSICTAGLHCRLPNWSRR